MAACGGGGGDDSVPVAFAAQPADASVVEGETLSLTVAVNGDADLQWQRLQPTGWADLAGAQSARYTLAPVRASDNGAQFRVVATSRHDRAHQIVSSVVTLTVQTTALAPAITVQPVAVSAVDGQDVGFSVTATGTSASYRWQRSNAGGDWVDIAQATTPTLALRAALTDDGATFRVVVSNSLGSVTSVAVPLRVAAAAAPSFVVSPLDATTVAGQSTGFYASAVGAPTPTIRWQMSADGSTWSDITGATGNNLVIAQTSIADDRKRFRAVATNPRGDVVSSVAQLLVQAPAAPMITSQPQDVSVGLGMAAIFVAQATGVPSVSYQWQVSVDGGLTFSNVNQATSASLAVVPAQLSESGKRFRVVVTNTVGAATSASAQMRVLETPVITLEPTRATWRPGQRDALFVSAARGSNLQFQWQLSADHGASWSNAPGATATDYVHAANAAASTNAVRVVVSNDVGSVASITAPLEALRWQIVEPRPTGVTLTGAVWRDASTVLASGAAGTILRSTDAGTTWTVVSENASDFVGTLGLAFDANGVGITTSAAGSGNLPIKRSVDGGLHWVDVGMPVTNGLVAVSSTNTGAFCLAGNNGVILRSADAGLSWQTATSDAGTVALKAMAFNADGVGVIVGNGGAILRSINGGANWTRVGNATANLTAVAFATRDSVFAGAEDGTLLRSNDAGQSWQTVASGTSQPINSLHFGSATAGVMALSQGGIRVTTDGGSSWNPAGMSPSGVSVYAVGAGPAGRAIAVGEYGSIFRSVDGGLNWTTVALGGFDRSLRGVAFSTASNGVAVGVGGRMLRSTDAGLTWTPAASGTTSQLEAVGFFDALTGVALGTDGSMVRTTDGGTSWSPTVTGTAAPLVAFARVSATTGVSVTTNGLLRTTDAGATWSPTAGAPVLQINALAFNGAQIGLAVGNAGVVHRSMDGGQTWTPVSSGTANSLNAVTFASATAAYAVGANGVVLRSSDAGMTWQVGQFPVYSDYAFNGIAFTSSTTGVAVGASGTVMLTRDSGASWWPDYTQRNGVMNAVSRAGSQAVVTVGAGGVITRIDSP